jgi:hypothetical protein
MPQGKRGERGGVAVSGLSWASDAVAHMVSRMDKGSGYRQQRLEKRSLSKLIADDLAANVLPLTQIHCTSLSRTLIDYH